MREIRLPDGIGHPICCNFTQMAFDIYNYNMEKLYSTIYAMTSSGGFQSGMMIFSNDVLSFHKF